MSVCYQQIVAMGFGMSTDDYDEAVAVADAATRETVGADAPSWPGLYRGCTEWVSALVEYLSEWDYGDPVECESDRPGIVGPEWDEREHGGYLLQWSNPYSSVALYRMVDDCPVCE